MLRYVWGRWTGKVASIVIVALVVIGVFGKVLAPQDPTASVGELLDGPSIQHWFGTDYMGRDVFSRMLDGAGISLLGALLVSVVAFIVGTAPGILSVYFGRLFEWVSLRLVDTIISLPFLIVAVAATALIGNGLLGALIVVGVLVSPVFYRVARSVALQSISSDYVLASRLLGASWFWVVRRHILPRLLPALAVTFANTVASGLIVISSLAFLGIGVQPPAATWGGVLASTLPYISQNPIGPVIPALIIIVAVWSVHAFADLLRDAETEIAPDAHAPDARETPVSHELAITDEVKK